MNFKEFEEYYEKLNKKETEKYCEYGEVYFWVDYIFGKNKINYLDKFIKVFDNYFSSDILVDENIGCITNTDDIYVNEDFLDFCIKNKLEKEDAYNFYYRNYEQNMDTENFISYEETLKTFKKQKNS